MSEKKSSYMIALKKFSHLQINRVMKENPASDVIVIEENHTSRKIVIIRSEFLARFSMAALSGKDAPKIANEVLSQGWGYKHYTLVDSPGRLTEIGHSLPEQKYRIANTLASVSELREEIKAAKEYLERIYVKVHTF